MTYKDYIGRRIQLWPGDYNKKCGTIVNVDDLGFTIKIYYSNGGSFKPEKEYFISHSKSFIFEFLD